MGTVDILEIRGSQLVVKDELRGELDNLVRNTGEGMSRETHELMGASLFGPIEKLARYQEWGRFFFMQETGNVTDQIRVVQDEYHIIVFEVSPDGEFFFNRPGWTYATVTFETFKVGLELSWRQMRQAGWNVMERKLQEVADELARKRDSKRRSALDAAVTSVSGHTSTVATTMTKASVDAILKSARQSGSDITVAAINSGTVMDMGSWTIASSPLWASMPEDLQRELFTNLWVSNYGGVNWFASKDVPSGYVYFSAGPTKTGWEWTAGGPHHFFEQDVPHGVDRHAWELDVALRVDNPYAVYRLAIT